MLLIPFFSSIIKLNLKSERFNPPLSTPRMTEAPPAPVTEVVQVAPAKSHFENDPKLFGRWDYKEIKITDPCFTDYIALEATKAQVWVPHTAGRYQVKKFRKAQCPIVERLVGKLAHFKYFSFFIFLTRNFFLSIY